MSNTPGKYRRRKERNLEHYVWKLTKFKAKREDLPFNLEVSDITIPRSCPVLGIELDAFSEDRRKWPTVDRLRPGLGYVKGNVAIISFRANNIKSNATPEELKAILRYMKRMGYAKS